MAGLNDWKYHGLLVAAEPPPLGRVVMLSQMIETATGAEGKSVLLQSIKSPFFRFDRGLPQWEYQIGDAVLQRSLVMPYRQNTICIRYRLLHGSGPVRLKLEPKMRFRQHEANFEGEERLPFSITPVPQGYEVDAGQNLPILRMSFSSLPVEYAPQTAGYEQVFFNQDAARGNDPDAALWSAGEFSFMLEPETEMILIASTEDWPDIGQLAARNVFTEELKRRENLLSQAPDFLQESFPAALILAADQFLIDPQGRIKDKKTAAARGDSIRAVIAGYHWFTDWGRDTMIALEGLALVTGRHEEAKWILRAFADYIGDGLIPNFFPDGKDTGVYHTADATLWYFHAVDRYISYTQDHETLRLLLPHVVDIADCHLRGTRFGIHVDPDDHLLVQGEEGYQLTWMDAKVDGWVVTPRRGKAVEINALWYNAISLLSHWLQEAGEMETAAFWQNQAAQTKDAFNRCFWIEREEYLYDVIDSESGHDLALRPNQIIALSLRYPVLEQKRWKPVLEKIRQELLTPYGLRTLSPSHPDYKTQYSGDLRARDAAYHQGTVWPWLLGPFIDAWLALYPDDTKTTASFLDAFKAHLNDAGMGSISEIFDAGEAYTPRGCISQAWSVAEILRSYAKVQSMSGK